MRNAYKMLAGKPERKRLLGIPRHRWMDNIKMDLWDIGFGGVSWIHLAQDKDRWRTLANMVNEPSGSIKCGEYLHHLSLLLASEEAVNYKPLLFANKG
jgi:hypothetical protein